MSRISYNLPALSNEGGLAAYLAQIKKFPMLDAEEEFMLAKNWKTTGNVKSAEKLVTSHLRLVAKIAMGYKGYGLPLNEMISEGNVGLMQAVKKFEPEKGVRNWVKKNKRKIYIYNDPKKAASGADVIFSDKVISLNDKVNKKKKIQAFKKFKIDKKLMGFANKNCIFLHCLPRGNEVSEDIFLGKKSHVWVQALNRVHVQKSILLYCFGKLR